MTPEPNAPSTLNSKLQTLTKEAMRAQDKPRLQTLRLINSAIKQFQVDQRKEPTDQDILGILQKMLKQRRDSIEQFKQGGRDDLAKKEQSEIDIIQEFMPEPLTDQEIEQIITTAITETGANSNNLRLVR